MVFLQFVKTGIDQVVADVIRPLVESDGGQIEVEAVGDDEIVVTLSGVCAGCPGVHYTRTHVIEPALRSVAGARVRIQVRTTAAAVTARGDSSP